MTDVIEREHDARYKDLSLRQKSTEIFNAHQVDTRKRVDTLARTIFLVGGGALTLSIGVFLRKEARSVPPDLIVTLQSWVALFYSILAFVLVMAFMILGSYTFGERWRKQLIGEKVGPSNWPRWAEIPQWAFGITGLFAFFYGLGALAWVAVKMVGRSA